MKNKYARFVRLPLLVVLIAAMAGCQKMDIDAMKVDPLNENQVEVPVTTYSQIPGAGNRYIVIFNEDAITHPALLTEKEGATTAGHSIARLRATSKDEIIRRDDLMWQESAVILKENSINSDAIQTVFSGPVKGLAANLDSKELETLLGDPRVKRVEEDRMIALNYDPITKTPFIPSGGMGIQKTPYGVERVGGSTDFTQDPNFATRRVWILDTGIDIDHPDLNVDTAYSRNFTADPSFDDGFGHGTHVAGIIGAKNNSFGVTGVAAGIKLVAVKVLDDSGKGYTSDVLNGLSYIYQIASPGDVINISFGGTASASSPSFAVTSLNGYLILSPDTTVDTYISDLGDKGCFVTIAAGNEGVDAIGTSPAKVNHTNVYTVGSINWSDDFSWFSNYGSCVDYVAPGEGILSTYKDNMYGWLTGTSMAAPHMAGVLAATGGVINTSGSTKGKYKFSIISR